MTDRNERCETCAYYSPVRKRLPGASPYLGDCIFTHLVNPSAFVTFKGGMTLAHYWCREWKAKDETP